MKHPNEGNHPNEEKYPQPAAGSHVPPDRPPAPARQPGKFTRLEELVAPVTRSIPELLEEAVDRHEKFKALVEKDEAEFEVYYTPPKPDKKQELTFRFRS